MFQIFPHIYSWLPLPLRVVVIGALVAFFIWILTGIIKRIWDILPFV